MAATRREPMLETGEELFLRRGYAGVGLRELLDAVQASKGAFYHFFPSKEAFGLAVLERHLARRTADMASHFDGGTGLDKVLAWFRQDWQAQEAADFTPRCLLNRLAGDVGGGFPAEPVRDGLDGMAAVLAGFLEAGQADGHLYKDLNPLAAARHLADLWHGATERARVERTDGAARAALAHFEAWLKP